MSQIAAASRQGGGTGSAKGSRPPRNRIPDTSRGAEIRTITERYKNGPVKAHQRSSGLRAISKLERQAQADGVDFLPVRVEVTHKLEIAGHHFTQADAGAGTKGEVGIVNVFTHSVSR